MARKAGVVLRSGLALGLFLWALQALANGFTPVSPSRDSLLIYVSDSLGADTHDCLSESTPCKTLAAGIAKMRAGFPDHLYLRAGDAWHDQALTGIKSGRSDTERAVVTSYGQGSRPAIITTTKAALHTGGGGGRMRFSHVNIQGLEFNYLTHGGATVVLLGQHDNVLFEDNRFTGEMVLQNWESGRLSNIVLRRNIFTGAYATTTSTTNSKRPSNVYAEGVDGLQIIENVLDYGGWHPTIPGAGANMYNHNLYLQHSNGGATLRVVGNIVTRASSHGMQARSGGYIEGNYFARNAVSLAVGYQKPPVPDDVDSRVLNNVIHEGHSMIKGNLPCMGANLCTSAVWGVYFVNYGGRSWESRNNIVALQSPDDRLWMTHVPVPKQGHFTTGKLSRDSFSAVDPANVVQSGNIGYRFETDTEGTDQPYRDPSRTLATYNAWLGGEPTFEAFMERVLQRPAGTWNAALSASAINDYVRGGFSLASASSASSSSSSSSSSSTASSSTGQSSSSSSSSSGSSSSSSSSSSGGSPSPIVLELNGSIRCVIEADPGG